MTLLISGTACGPSSRLGPTGNCLRSSLPATNSLDNVGNRKTYKNTLVYPYDSASPNCIVSGEGHQQLHHGREPPRGIRCGSACPTVVSHDSSTRNRMSAMNRTNTGSTLQTRVPSTITLDVKGDVLGVYSKSVIPGSGGFGLDMDSFLGARRHRPQHKSKPRGLAIRCSISVPVPDDCSPTDTATMITAGEVSNKHSSVVNETDKTGMEPIKAAFFDVDGTITRTNVVFAYLCVRMAELKFIKKLLWVPWFLLSCIVYLIVDHFHRPTFNRMFYSSYKGRQTDGKTSMANLVFEKYYKPRIMARAAEHILELKRLGYLIVLVTGALDFQIEPLAQELGADFLYAAKLVEENGRFTGGLQGMAFSNSEKAERVWEYAKRHGVSLRDSLAFGDSIADIPMLEVVGKPYAVNPDARLQAIALKRGWAILNWKVKTQKTAASVWEILKWRIYKKNNTASMSA